MRLQGRVLLGDLYHKGAAAVFSIHRILRRQMAKAATPVVLGPGPFARICQGQSSRRRESAQRFTTVAARSERLGFSSLEAGEAAPRGRVGRRSMSRHTGQPRCAPKRFTPAPYVIVPEVCLAVDRKELGAFRPLPNGE